MMPCMGMIMMTTMTMKTVMMMMMINNHDPTVPSSSSLLISSFFFFLLLSSLFFFVLLLYQVVTLDAGIDRLEMLGALDETAWVSGKRATVQGNFDTNLLINGDPSSISSEVSEMIRQLGPQNMIANLGGGLMGKEDPSLVKCFVDEVKSQSQAAFDNMFPPIKGRS